MKRVRKRTRKRTFSIFDITDTDVVHYVFLYEHGHVSLFRVRDPRTFTKFTTFTHRNSLLPLAKRQIQIDMKASTVVPDKSTSLARRAGLPRADESEMIHGAMIES
jgi:hypothetical protein